MGSRDIKEQRSYSFVRAITLRELSKRSNFSGFRRGRFSFPFPKLPRKARRCSARSWPARSVLPIGRRSTSFRARRLSRARPAGSPELLRCFNGTFLEEERRTP